MISGDGRRIVAQRTSSQNKPLSSYIDVVCSRQPNAIFNLSLRRWNSTNMSRRQLRTRRDCDMLEYLYLVRLSQPLDGRSREVTNLSKLSLTSPPPWRVPLSSQLDLVAVGLAGGSSLLPSAWSQAGFLSQRAICDPPSDTLHRDIQSAMVHVQYISCNWTA